MTDPIRLRETGTAFDVALMESAKDDVPGKHVRTQLHTALGLGAGAGALGAATVAKASAGSAKGASTVVTISLAKWIGAGAIAALVVAKASTFFNAPPAALPVTPMVVTVHANANETIPAIAASTVNAPPVILDPVIAKKTSSQSADSPPSVVPAASASNNLLAEELSTLDAAHAAFDSGNLDLAIADLNRHDLEFIHGQLAPEALALRIEVYAARHDATKVDELAHAFLARYSEHPQAAHVRALMQTSSK